MDNRQPLSEGAEVRPYRIIRLVGKGGLGLAYEAEASDGKRVLIKEHFPLRV